MEKDSLFSGLDSYFESRSYCVGYTVSPLDQSVMNTVTDIAEDVGSLSLYPHLQRFCRHIHSCDRFPHLEDQEELPCVLNTLARLGKVLILYEFELP